MMDDNMEEQSPSPMAIYITQWTKCRHTWHDGWQHSPSPMAIYIATKAPSINLANGLQHVTCMQLKCRLTSAIQLSVGSPSSTLSHRWKKTVEKQQTKNLVDRLLQPGCGEAREVIWSFASSLVECWGCNLGSPSSHNQRTWWWSEKETRMYNLGNKSCWREKGLQVRLNLSRS